MQDLSINLIDIFLTLYRFNGTVWFRMKYDFKESIRCTGSAQFVLGLRPSRRRQGPSGWARINQREKSKLFLKSLQGSILPLAYKQGCNRHIFLRGQSHFSWFFSRGEMFFPGRKFPFWYTQNKFPSFSKVTKKEKKKKKKVLTSFYNFSYFYFQFSTFHFTIFLPFFLILPLFHFFPCLFFPNT